MDNNWYIFIQGQNQGPYSIDAVRNMLSQGAIPYNTLVYNESIGDWKTAGDVFGYPAPASTPPKKKGKGCLIAILALFTAFAVFVSGVFGVVFFLTRPLRLGSKTNIARTTIGSAGGVIETDDITIEIPAGSFSGNQRFRVSKRDIQNHNFGEHFNPASPLFKIDNRGKWSEDPMTVTIPINIAEHEFAMAFYYTSSGELEPLPLVYQDSSSIVVATRHFSDIVTTKIDKQTLYDLEFDTGFTPGVDNWPFVNRGSQLTRNGYCAGSSASMVYYFTNLKGSGNEPLFTRYDNNGLPMRTPNLEHDDSLGIRLASVVQHRAYFDSFYFRYLRESVHRQKVFDDSTMFLAFAYAMLLTEEPQLMGIFVREANADEEINLRAGHAIVIHKIKDRTMYVVDPNYPTRSDLRIPFDGGVLGPYTSRINADDTDRLYNSFSLIGKSALFDWNSIGTLFREMDNSSQTSTIGNGLFGGVIYNILVDNVDGEPVFANSPEELFLEEEAKNRVYQAYSGIQGAPADWETRDYIIVSFSNGAIGNGVLRAYSGTRELSTTVSQGNQFRDVFIPLDRGLNDIGLGFFDRIPTTVNNTTVLRERFMHFHRVRIQNGEDDLTGTWEGTYQITDLGRLLEFVERMAVIIVKWIMRFASSAFDVDMPSDAEIERAVKESIEINEGALDPHKITIELTRIDEQTYDAFITMEGDETQYYSTTVSYVRGKLKFSIVFQEGGTAEFEYFLYDSKTISGSFKIHYGVRNAVEGISSLSKTD